MSRALGRYELVRPLARGGMGEVYLARRRAAGVEKWLVVKRMRPERSGDTRFLDLFMREAKLSMSLAHQNIVPVFDFGRIDDQVFLAMERVEGKDLGSSLQKAGKPLPPLIAGFIAAECLQALDYAHRRKGPDGHALGIVHRDVTPRNVLLSWSGEVKLTDFGIAALASDVTSRTAGTPAYMAPEQARGEPLDVRADIYALGLVLYEALIGARARRGNDRDTVLEVAKQGLLEPWPESLDTPLRAIVERASDLDKTKRYPDARSMLEEIDAFIVTARATTKAESPARQLATWLTDVWADTRDDEGAMDAQIDAGALVSFLDDGPLDIIGTGTELSALATQADASEPKPSDAAPGEQSVTGDEYAPSVPAPDGATGRDSQRALSNIGATRPTTDAGGTSESPSASAVVTSPSTASRRVLLVVVGAAVAIGAIALLTTRRDDKPPQRSNVPASQALLADAGTMEPVVPEDMRDAGTALEAVADAAIAAAAPDAGTMRPRPRPTGREPDPRVAGGSGSGSTAGSAGPGVIDKAPVKRRVTINSKPWSNWTVDGGAQHSGLDTIELSPGTHVIHFTGNPYFKADKKVTVTVPDKDGFTYVETLDAAPATP